MKINKGFTLLEVLIAIFIFTLISMILVTSLRQVIQAESVTRQKTKRIEELELVFLLLSRDLMQVVNRPITHAKGNVEAAFIGSGSHIRFTHGGFQNPNDRLNRSTLQRTEYTISGNHVVRTTWPVLDQVAKTLPEERVLALDIADVRFEYLNARGQFEDQWSGKAAFELPIAVRVTLTLASLDKITQLLLLSGYHVANPA